MISNELVISLQAQSATVAEIWLWQVGSWKAVGRLQSHNLTVTNMQFSHDNAFLLAVSRDRQFSLFSINTTGTLINYFLQKSYTVLMVCTLQSSCRLMQLTRLIATIKTNKWMNSLAQTLTIYQNFRRQQRILFWLY